ncbi:MAG: polysaccharide deacetylase family protein [Sphingomonadales bacterium]|jgi:hypothetical protein
MTTLPPDASGETGVKGRREHPTKSTSDIQLLCCIDVEEEFDWSRPFQRDGYGLSSMQALPAMVAKMKAWGVRPVLLVDYPVLNDVEASSILKSLVDDVELGTQLHAWVTPPFEEALSKYNSYAGNLPEPVERAKLEALTAAFEKVFGFKPKIFRSGRYGFGPNTAQILKDLGYEIDLSRFAHRDFSDDGGPDFSDLSTEPAYLDEQKLLLSIPSTSGYLGPLRPWGGEILKICANPLARIFHIRGVLVRLGLFGWTWLSPEGVSLRSAKALTSSLIRDGEQVFLMSFHSPSLVPGNTTYVQNERDKEQLLRWVESYIHFFKSLGGKAVTPWDIRDRLRD